MLFYLQSCDTESNEKFLHLRIGPALAVWVLNLTRKEAREPGVQRRNCWTPWLFFVVGNIEGGCVTPGEPIASLKVLSAVRMGTECRFLFRNIVASWFGGPPWEFCRYTTCDKLAACSFSWPDIVIFTWVNDPFALSITNIWTQDAKECQLLWKYLRYRGSIATSWYGQLGLIWPSSKHRWQIKGAKID